DPVRRRLERCEAFLQRGARGVRDARVVVALVLPDGVLHERRGLVDRRDDRPGRRIRLLSIVNRAGLEVHAQILRAMAPPTPVPGPCQAPPRKGHGTVTTYWLPGRGQSRDSCRNEIVTNLSQPKGRACAGFLPAPTKAWGQSRDCPLL